jgi:Stress responsive A/B Barrel Domain
VVKTGIASGSENFRHIAAIPPCARAGIAHGMAMLTHTVLFWLKPDLAPAARAEFESTLRTLLAIPGSTRAMIGRPSTTTERPVVDHSYDYALELDFPDVAAHDLYQDHPDHLAFIAKCKEHWTQVKVYDFDHL